MSRPLTRPVLESDPYRRLRMLAEMRGIPVEGKSRGELVELILTAEATRNNLVAPSGHAFNDEGSVNR